MSTHFRFPLAKSISRTLFSSPQGLFCSVPFLILITSCHLKLSSSIHFVDNALKYLPRSSGVLEDLDDVNFKMVKHLENNLGGEVGKALDSPQGISVSRVAAAVAALYERSMLEGKMRSILYAQPPNRYQRVAEHGVMTAKAVEERPIIDHDGLPRQRLSNQVLRDMIEEVKLAGGIGCFEKGVPLHSSSSTGKDQKESDFGYSYVTTTDASPRSYKQWKGENHADGVYPTDIRTNTVKRKRYKEYDSGSSERQHSHRSYKRSDRSDDEFTRTKRRSQEKESYHQNHRSSREKSSLDYKTRRDDRYDSRRSREPRNQNSFEDRYNPLERD